jgi:hypothetical protein
MSGGAFPGCGIHESADGHVALSEVEPHFFERALWALGVDGCRDAIRGAFAARPPGSWKPLPHRQISPEPGAVEVVDVDFEVSDVARRCAGQLFISSKRPAGSIYRRVTRCQAVRARLPFSGRQGKEIGSDGNSNAHGSEGVRRDRLSGTTAASIAALNSTAGSSFGAPRGPRPAHRAGQLRMKPCRKRLYRHCSAPLRLPAASASALRTPGQQVFDGRHGPVFNISETSLILIKQRYPDPIEHRRDSLTVSPKIKHARESRSPCRSG